MTRCVHSFLASNRVGPKSRLAGVLKARLSAMARLVLTLLLVPGLLHGARASSRRRTTTSDDSCSGTASCGSWEQIVGQEQTNGVCEFGHTSKDHYPEQCEVPCKGHVDYICTCVTQADAVAGNTAGKTTAIVAGGVLIGVALVVAGIMFSCYFLRQESKTNCCLCVSFTVPSIITVLGVIFLALGLSVDEEADYWSGC
eukprot:TRINITY_DN111803_c0_g1_i1.p1 TRINITY_DN111803_c0_g1~~TRINITY_DN111803_c0_g1_i1.p1  ORF type:complete len:199 (-),score=2.88 TRINITY_DN111803_c0_g1_i1:196-792(-)